MACVANGSLPMADATGKKGLVNHKLMLKEINKSLHHQINNRVELQSGKSHGFSNLTPVEQLSLQNLASVQPGDRKSFPTRSTKNALEEIRSYLQQFRCDGDQENFLHGSSAAATSSSHERHSTNNSFLKIGSVSDLNTHSQEYAEELAMEAGLGQDELTNGYMLGFDRVRICKTCFVWLV